MPEFSLLTFEAELQELIDTYCADGTITYPEVVTALEKKIAEIKMEDADG